MVEEERWAHALASSLLRSAIWTLIEVFGVIARSQGLAEVPVWEVLQSGADWNHGAVGIWKVHLNEHPCWIQVTVIRAFETFR